ncbi:Uu.00g050070.m01.CDS01 [Anthostomella pinea]|uniref:Uu.00g050070.m01.CDS01 n=1 Tax=Anthostomella pinea TaxID=933095 RepID=A0AAI8VTE8_9PEZI|nr:Uu.00g050070.m01.CDS01 [Anthostomella pinea]
MSANGAWKRLQRGMPAIMLGTLFNVLDAVSTGLLVFPSDGRAFAGLQNKSMSTYIMSSILSQVAMTLGGSLFPGALGAMLIEVLPFMRGVASDIRNALGDDNPAVVPTVMVAYAMSSFLIGIVFLLLGALGFGRLISYFPQTVLTGAIGGIGVSLFILGLELPLPSDQHLSLSNAGTVLFSKQHVPLLLASLLPIFFMCYSVRSETLNKLTRGAVQHPYYVPLYFLAIAALFWIIVGGLGVERLGGLHGLAASGWLFSTGESLGGGKTNLADALNYWSLFDFRLVEISALGHAVTNFVLLVVIGVLNLPVYVPALALALDVPYSMNHELIGQGAANILAGAVGSLPNILQLSYSVFFTRAGGRRIEAGVVILLTLVLFFVSSYLLLYIPTILASGLVLFLGIELTLEAVWESAKDLIWTEWLVVMATLLACAFVGFAPGVGVGIAAAVVVYTGWGCWDLRARPGYVERNLTILDQHSKHLHHHSHRLRANAGYSRLPDTAPEESGVSDLEEKLHPQIRLVHLNGYVFFGVIPSVEAQLIARVKSKGASIDPGAPHEYVVVDLQSVNRVETAAARVIRTKARDTSGVTLVLCGLSEGSGTAADLVRSGLDLTFAPADGAFPSEKEGSIRAFDGCDSALGWCKADVARREIGTLSEPVVKGHARQRFLELFPPRSSSMSGLSLDEHDDSIEAEAMEPSINGFEVKLYKAESNTIPRPTTEASVHFTFVSSGSLDIPSCTTQTTTSAAAPRVRYNRASLRATVINVFRQSLDIVMRRPRSDEALQKPSSDNEGASDSEATDVPTPNKRQAYPGHTTYVPPQVSQGLSSVQEPPYSGSDKAADEICTAI